MSVGVAVLGAGSWGTALAWLAGGNGMPVRLWCRCPQQAEQLCRDRSNARYLPGVLLPPSVEATADLPLALGGAALVVVAVPAGAVRDVLRAAAAQLSPDAVVLLAAKGLEQESGLRLSQVAAEVLGSGVVGRSAVLSGPNLAGELVLRRPTATVVAAATPAAATLCRDVLGTGFFRIYGNPDVVGVELGGALKNPIALAAGITDGLDLGANARASLLTRGLAEMTRLGVAAGARAATFSGLSGLGDLVATAHSPLSRNYRLGVALGKGEPLGSALAALGQVAEGVPTSAAACRLAAALGVELPIVQALRDVLYQGLALPAAVAGLLSRPYRDEDQSE